MRRLGPAVDDFDALAKWGLNFVIEEYLPRKLANRKGFLP